MTTTQMTCVQIGPSDGRGVLIHRRAVLTAGHCVGAVREYGFVFLGAKTTEWPSESAQRDVLQPRDGLARYRAFMEQYTWVHDVDQVFTDPEYIEFGTDGGEEDHATAAKDLALIILKQPSGLPSAPLLPPGGHFQMVCIFDRFMHVTDATLATKAECIDCVHKSQTLGAGAQNYVSAIEDSSMLCARMPAGSGATAGDSGGPVTHMLPTGQHVLVGIVSSGPPAWGVSLPGGAGGTFNIFTNVLTYTRALHRILQSLA